MKLHTSLDGMQVRDCLRRAKLDGHVADDVMFIDGITAPNKSRTHAHEYDIHLGTWDKHTLPEGYTDQHGHKLSVRRFSNSGDRGATSEWATGNCPVWAATWHEWGFFMACVFALDPDAVFGSLKQAYGYHSEADFHAKTSNVFKEKA